MKTFFTTLTSVAILMSVSGAAFANDLRHGTTKVVQSYDGQFAEIEIGYRVDAIPEFKGLDTDMNIAVARIDAGRLIPTPQAEQTDWMFLDRRMDASFMPLDMSDYMRDLPETEQGMDDYVHQLDQIRITAANSGFEHVLIYGIGYDVSWDNFGGYNLADTGFDVPTGSESCLLYTSPSPRDQRGSRMPSSA